MRKCHNKLSQRYYNKGTRIPHSFSYKIAASSHLENNPKYVNQSFIIFLKDFFLQNNPMNLDPAFKMDPGSEVI